MCAILEKNKFSRASCQETMSSVLLICDFNKMKLKLYFCINFKDWGHKTGKYRSKEAQYQKG